MKSQYKTLGYPFLVRQGCQISSWQSLAWTTLFQPWARAWLLTNSTGSGMRYMNSQVMAVPCSFLLRKPTASAHLAWVEQPLLTLLPTCPGDSTQLADSSRRLKAFFMPMAFQPFSLVSRL